MSQLLDYAKCMRSHGVADYPDPIANPDGQGGGFNISGGPDSDLNRNNPTNKEADAACHSLLPAPTSGNSAQAQAAAVKLAKCMRSHGFPDFPDPNSQGAFNLAGIDMQSSQFQSAIKTCRTQANYQGPMRVSGGSGN